jgi:hypothetical protein
MARRPKKYTRFTTHEDRYKDLKKRRNILNRALSYKLKLSQKRIV